MSGTMNKLNPSDNRSEQTQLMERCVDRENMLKAWKKEKKNGGSPGVDGMTIEETGKDLKTTWPRIREQLMEGSYQPKAVRRVEIEKPGGGMRQLGIPTVTDRPIQQCILQILQRVKDLRMVKLIRRYLQAGIMDQGVVTEREEGTPQGGPLSPLLSNLLLNEVDWELSRRGLAFARYADDCNVYVKSKRAAERTMQTMRKIMGKLKLKINQEKSAAAYVGKRKFLGYSLWIGRNRVVKRKVSPQALQKFKEKVRILTSRTCGKSMKQVIDRLDLYLMGWKGYFQLADTPNVFADVDSWIRRRLRMLQLKQWKRGKTCYRELVARGLPSITAAAVAQGHRSRWRAAGKSGMNLAFPASYFDEMGLTRLKA
jgi:RNA-directed DNA polymerase